MDQRLLLFGLVAMLAACNNSDHTIVGGPVADDDFNAAAVGNVVLPPPIQASKTYRCADNVIVHVDWLADGKTATLRVGETGSPTPLSAAEAGQPMTAADGSSVTGTADASAVRIALPGKSAQSCKA